MRDQIADEALRQRTLGAFHELGYEILDGAAEQGGACSVTGRRRDSEVVLVERLRHALERLNPDQPSKLIDEAIEELTRDRSMLDTAHANREIYWLLKDGVKLAVTENAAGTARSEEKVTIRVIEWEQPEKNDFLLVSNFRVNGSLGRGRLDYVGFVNGLPWLLPVVHSFAWQREPLRHLYETVINENKRRFPQLFWYNALILLSDGDQSKMGNMTAAWEHFVEWKRVEREDEPQSRTLETLLRGTCAPARLLDIVENFTLFSEEPGTLVKIIARNHQYLGVNAAFERMQHIKALAGKIGVFWHTQGAGKSYSMIFFEQKVQRKLPGNWTFVIITDREDLDKQIYDNFKKAGAISEPEVRVRARNREHLKRMLGEENHSIIFTLIQKFQPDKSNQEYEKLSDRDDIIVISDEAHRSQYDTLAGNMRRALPNASFIGFTGTPLIEDEEHETRETFGPYVSKYPFLQAIQDGVTVPLIYENRTPEIVLRVPEAAQALQQLEASAGLNEEQKRKLRQELFQRDTIIRSAARLDFVAEDIVRHCVNRGYRGKAMVVCIDKLTTVRTYNRVRQAWQRYQAELEQQLQEERDPERYAELAEKIEYMRTTQMAVVVSESEDDEKSFAEFNDRHPDEQLDIRPHHELARREKLDERFKKESDELRIAFVCSMWMTGFDVPCLSTIYLDHPMQRHTLMQAIARPNRVYGTEKTRGQVVDYVGIYNDLLRALNIYARSEQDSALADADIPLRDKSELVGELDQALNDLVTFCQQQGIDVAAKLAAVEAAQSKAERDVPIREAANTLVSREETKLNYLDLAWKAYRLYEALLPDKEASAFKQRASFFRKVQQTILFAMRCASIDEVLIQGQRMIAESMQIEPYDIRRPGNNPHVLMGQFDLSQLDFDALAESLRAEDAYLRTERLRSLLTSRLQAMIHVNPTRVNYLDRLQEIINKSNESSANQADYPEEIVEFARELRDEEQRHEREQLSEEELTIVDLLISTHPSLNETDWQQVKAIARTLMHDLHSSGNLVRDWYKHPTMNGGVRTIIYTALNELPDSYTVAAYRQLCEDVYDYIRAYYEDYGGNGGPISA